MEAVKVGRAAQKRFAVANAPDLNHWDALEWYDKAGRGWSERPDKAAWCYARCAEAMLRVKEGLGAASFYARSAELREPHDPEAAVHGYDRACEICCDERRWDAAGVLALRAARIDGDAARFEAAADLLAESRTETSLRYECLEEAAERFDDPARKAALFETLAAEHARDNLTAPNTIRYFLKAALCHLVVDPKSDLVVGKSDVFAHQYPPWAAAPERRFVLDVHACFASGDLPDRHAFADRAYDLAAVRDLDVAELDLLQRIHGAITTALRHDELLKAKAARKAARAKQREDDARDRRNREDRDRRPPSRGWP